MQATTIKVDPKLHSSIRRLKAREQSVTGFVRELIAGEEKRRTLESAAMAYTALMTAHQDEAAWLLEWESAPLAAVPKRRKA